MFTIKGIRRGVGPRTGEDGKEIRTSFDALGTITFVVKSADDRSESFEIGYELERVENTFPENFRLPSESIRITHQGE